MKRAHQHCVTCTDEEWRQIKARAAEAGMKISHFVVRCALDEGPAMRLALSEEEQRALYNRVNLLLLACLDLTAPLPGTEVTPREAVEFLWRAGGAQGDAPPPGPGDKA